MWGGGAFLQNLRNFSRNDWRFLNSVQNLLSVIEWRFHCGPNWNLKGFFVLLFNGINEKEFFAVFLWIQRNLRLVHQSNFKVLIVIFNNGIKEIFELFCICIFPVKAMSRSPPPQLNAEVLPAHIMALKISLQKLESQKIWYNKLIRKLFSHISYELLRISCQNKWNNMIQLKAFQNHLEARFELALLFSKILIKKWTWIKEKFGKKLIPYRCLLW